MMSPGMIILLNGTTSSGKSSIARALQELLPEPYLYMGADILGMMAPPSWAGGARAADGFSWVPLPSTGPPLTELRPGAAGHRFVEGLHHAVAALSRHGHGVIVDHILQDQRWVAHCRDTWRGLPVLFVAVRCPVEVAERRERERGDRTLGVARWQFPLVHAHGPYDLEVDTSVVRPRDAAALVASRLAEGLLPSALF